MNIIRLVVNADDFGRAPEVNAGIELAFRDGIVTSTSIMTNFPAFEEAVELAVERRIPVGLHVNLTEGKPLSDASLIPSLVDVEGLFPGKVEFFMRVKRRQISPVEARREIEAQLAKAAQRLSLDHLDGHHHVHTVPMIAEICHDLAVAAGIPFIRYVSRPKYFFPLHAALQQWTQHAVIGKGLKPRLRCADHFWGYELWLAEDKERALDRVIGSLRPGLNELMCHPALLGDGPRTARDRQRANELYALCGEKVKEKIVRRGIVLTNFAEAADRST
ncbi:MAG: ChbG/HpnK family deacetylase [candidate division KSB1 bacterium]|nr:ChbG/HpnK family deacetylase [candidate division KSB1 bacterium]